MDFFGHQDKARNRSGWIYLLFFVFVGILGVINGVLTAVLLTWGTAAGAEGDGGITMQDSEVMTIAVGAMIVTYLVVFGGTLIEWLQYSAGGERVAQMLGGKQIQQHTQDREERRLLNIVEEMAIASGMPVPKVFILEEEGVNAFAAGKTPSDSVIGVTRGALRTFNREEMQGVVAHEFSHILNGDVRKNLRLAALVFGIFCLYFLGQTVLRSALYARAGSSRNNKDSGGGVVVILVIGAVLCVMGLLGQFLGRILQMAHSRQREFLADASAVQFTRNPEGIGNALIKLSQRSSRLKAPRSNSLNHLFFGETALAGMLSSHPPLKERIRRVLPNWSGKAEPVSTRESEAESTAGRAPSAGMPAGHAAMAGFAGGEAVPLAQQLSGNDIAAGDLISRNLKQNADSEVSEEVLTLSHELLGARFIIDCLLLSDQGEIRERQVKALLARLHPAEQHEFLIVMKVMQKQPLRARFATLEHTLPTLQQISDSQFQELMQEVDELIAADGRISYWEFLMRFVVQHHFAKNCGYEYKHDPKPQGALSVAEAAGIVMRMLCQADGQDHKTAWNAAAKVLDSSSVVYPEGAFPPHWTILQQAFKRVAQANASFKAQLINAGVAAVLSNNRVDLEEMEILRLLGMVMEIPIPPLPVAVA